MRRLIVIVLLLWTSASLAQPTATTLVVLYGSEAGSGADSVKTLQGVEIVATLIPPDSTGLLFDTSTGLHLGKAVVVTAVSVANGHWRMGLIPSDYISPFGSVWHIVGKSGSETRFDVSVAVNFDADSVCLKQVLGQGTCP